MGKFSALCSASRLVSHLPSFCALTFGDDGQTRRIAHIADWETNLSMEVALSQIHEL
jgi:hypothetical protein